MRRKLLTLATWLLALAVLLSACGIGSDDSQMKDEETTPENEDQAPQGFDETIFWEQALVGHIMGGLFFVPDRGEAAESVPGQYWQLRSRAVATLHQDAVLLAELAASVSAAMESQEALLMDYAATIEQDEHRLLPEIAEGILASRLMRLGQERQLAVYLAGRPEDPLTQATLQRLTFESASLLAQHQLDHLGWLLGSAEVIITLLDKEDEAKAGALMAESSQQFGQELGPALADMLQTWIQLAHRHAHIVTAEYHMDSFHLELAESQFAMVSEETFEEHEELKAFFDQLKASDRRPGVLLPAPEDFTPEPDMAGPPRFVRLSSQTPAHDYDEYMSAYLAIHFLNQALTEDSTGHARSADDIMVDMLLDAELHNAIRDSYQRHIEQGLGSDYRAILLEASRLEDVEVHPESVEQTKTLTDGVKEGIREAPDRSGAIRTVSMAQTVLQGMNLNPFETTQGLFSTMLSMVNAMLQTQQSLSPELVGQVQQALNEDLEDILGDQLERFMEIIMETAAEELVAIFDQWQASIGSLEGLTVDRDTVFSLLDMLGIYIEREVLPAAIVEHWTGTFLTAERTDVFADGATQSVPTSNDAQIIRFHVVRENEEEEVLIDEFWNFEIDSIEVLEFSYEAEDFWLLLLRDTEWAVSHYAFEGTLDESQQEITGYMQFETEMTDAYLESRDPDDPFIPSIRRVTTGAWQAGRVFEGH